MQTPALFKAPAPIALTPRETEVLDLIARGLTAKLIARQLGISPNTVRAHRDNLRRKLCVRNVAQLGYYQAAHATGLAASANPPHSAFSTPWCLPDASGP